MRIDGCQETYSGGIHSCVPIIQIGQRMNLAVSDLIQIAVDLTDMKKQSEKTGVEEETEKKREDSLYTKITI